MPKFEAFQPNSAGTPLPGLCTRVAGESDVSAIAELISVREGRSVDAAVEGVRSELAWIAEAAGAARKYLCVATHGGRVVGFGRATYMPMSEIEGAVGMPDGWYLTGVIVDPAVRRRGVGRALTTHRLEWLGSRTYEAYYFANARNLVSTRLHEQCGFREVTRDIAFPGMHFEGGIGICFRAPLGGQWSGGA